MYICIKKDNNIEKQTIIHREDKEEIIEALQEYLHKIRRNNIYTYRKGWSDTPGAECLLDEDFIKGLSQDEFTCDRSYNESMFEESIYSRILLVSMVHNQDKTKITLVRGEEDIEITIEKTNEYTPIHF